MTRRIILIVWCFCAVALVAPAVVAQVPPVPKSGASDSKARPKLFVAKRVQDLGSVFEGDLVAVRWTLENRGDAELVIDKTRTSCGCTIVELRARERLIPPGGSVELKAEFNTSRRRGDQAKTVTVYSNDPEEPEMKLEFNAKVLNLVEIKPSGLVNLGTLRRGIPSSRSIELMPGTGHKKVEILSVKAADRTPFVFQYEPYEVGGGIGQRIRVVAAEYVGLGTVSSRATFTLSVDGIQRDRVISMRAEVVGELSWRPKVVDATRQTSRAGKQLAPVRIRSTGRLKFEILEATAGEILDVAVKGGTGTSYSIVLTIKDSAPPGPFGATLRVRTDMLDQPLAEIPVFGIVAAPVRVDPPIVLLRQDGTDAGTIRRIKLQGTAQVTLNVENLACDLDEIKVVVDERSGVQYKHIRYLRVELVGRLPQGVHETMVTVSTNMEGAENIEIPVTIVVP